jgi:TolB-like protein/thioredoxin-like negative regulator of GroEL
VAGIAVAGLVAAAAAGTWLARERGPAPLLTAPAETNESERSPNTRLGALAELSEPGDIPERSIVVLPFVNMSPDPDQEYFSDGLSEELINVLARNPELKVTSRTSAFHFKNREADLPTIARQLGVVHVLEGSVRRSGDRIRVTVQLIDAQSDKQLWSESFDRRLDDVFALQDEIAGDVFRKLRVTLAESAPTRHRTDPEAYLRHFEARSLLQLDRDDLIPRAAALLEEAVAIDPAFVQAWTELARAHFRRGDQGASQWLTDRAAAIDPDDPVVNAWYGTTALMLPVDAQDLERAADHFRRALAADPTNVDVWRQTMFLLTRLARPRDAIRVGTWVLDRDPMCVICRNILGMALIGAGDFAEAERAFTLVLALAPESATARGHLAWSQLFQGKAQAALATLEGLAHPHPVLQWIRTVALRDLGDERILPRTLADMESDWGGRYPYLLAMGHAMTDDHDAAFTWLERSLAFPPEDVNYPHLLAALEPLHADPRWPALLESVRLLPEQLATIEFEVPLPGLDP